jgi:hypothetical protein
MPDKIQKSDDEWKKTTHAGTVSRREKAWDRSRI